MYTIVACVYRYISPRVRTYMGRVYVYICIAYICVAVCRYAPLAADINIAMHVACISPGAPFRDQISGTTRDLSRCEYIRAKVSLVYVTTLYKTLCARNQYV